jgi:ferric-dicitrate binding protein FerR (iron transport regulator)
VRYYAGDEAVRVAVIDGRVEARNRHETVVVGAGSVGRVTDSTARLSSEHDAPAYTEWTAGRLIFNETPAAVMLATVGRWYGYTFRLTDSTLATRRVIAAFRIRDTEETLQAIRQLLDVTMTFDGMTVLLSPRQTSPGAGGSTPRRARDESNFSTEVGK